MAASAGRFRDVAKATMPGELPAEGRAGQLVIRHGVVPDPNIALRGKRQRVAINIQTDALENEHARHRISDAAYWAARTWAAVMERSRPSVSGAGAWNPGNRVDMVLSHELAVLNRIARAADAVAVCRDVRPAIGLSGEAILTLVLLEGLALRAAAARLSGKSGTSEVFFWSETFRRSCEALADHWCSRHARPPRG
jgi:hypothetical protein